MRKSLACLAALAALILSVGTGVQPAGALPVADLASTTVASSEVISPVGGVVYYTITFSNTGAAVPALLRNKTTGGGTFEKGLSKIPGSCSAPANEAVDPLIVCDQILGAVPLTLDVAIKTVEGTIISASTAAIDPSAVGTVAEDDTDDNNSSASTLVENRSDLSEALVAHNQSLPYKTHTVKNTTGANGIVISLSDALPEGAVCGNTYCGPGLHLGFGTASDRQGMVQIVARFQTDPCRGIGAGKCHTIYERKNGSVTAVPPCGALVPLTTTCLESLAKEGRAFVHTFRMASIDPDLLPPGTVTLN